MSKRQKRKAKTSKRVTFASSPVYIPRNNSDSEQQCSTPKAVINDSILFGQISVQILLNFDTSAVRCFGSLAGSVEPCSLDI